MIPIISNTCQTRGRMDLTGQSGCDSNFTYRFKSKTSFTYRIKSKASFTYRIKSKASFTVEASLLMTIILPVLLALIYYGFFLHDKGVLNGASQLITAQADLNNWKKGENNRLGKQAKHLEGMAGPSKNISSAVTVSEQKAEVHYQASLSLPGLLPSLFGKNPLDTGAGAQRILLHPADLIRKIRGLEYVSSLLKGSKH